MESTSNYKIITVNGEEKEVIIENILGNNQYEISGYEYILESNIDSSIDSSNLSLDIHI